MTLPNEGLVIRAQSGFFTVQTDSGVVTCRLLGRLKQRTTDGDVCAVGDHVTIADQGDGTGMIEAVHERTGMISRIRTGIKRDFRQILLANPDQIVIVFACAEPEPHLRMLDRFLVIAEKQRLHTLIIANKLDLVTQQEAESGFWPLRASGLFRPVYLRPDRAGNPGAKRALDRENLCAHRTFRCGQVQPVERGPTRPGIAGPRGQ